MSHRLAPLSVIVVKDGQRFTDHRRHWVPEAAAAVADQLAGSGWPEVLVRDERNGRVLHLARHEWPRSNCPTTRRRRCRGLAGAAPDPAQTLAAPVMTS